MKLNFYIENLIIKEARKELDELLDKDMTLERAIYVYNVRHTPDSIEMYDDYGTIKLRYIGVLGEVMSYEETRRTQND